MSPLIGEKPSKELVNSIADKVLNYPKVLGIHDLVIHSYGPGKIFATIHVEVDSEESIIVTHDIMDNIEKDFKDELGIALTIHMDPIVVGDPLVDALQTKVVQAIHKLDKDLKIHDFRVVKGFSHTNILFDCIVPFEKDHSEESLKEYLMKEIVPEKEIYFYVIQIDRPFVS